MDKYEILMQKLEGRYYEGLLIEYEQDFLAPYLGELLLECLEVDKRYVAQGKRIRELEELLGTLMHHGYIIGCCNTCGVMRGKKHHKECPVGMAENALSETEKVSDKSNQGDE